MKEVQLKKSPIWEIKVRYQQEMKNIKKKKWIFKVKILLFIVFPVLIIYLAAEIARTFLRIKLRNFFAKPEEDFTPAKPVVRNDSFKDTSENNKI